MKDLTIGSDRLTVQVNALGAELKSVERDGLEYLWQGDKDIYARTSPTLFPIVGRFLSDTYYVGDEAYHMQLNGIAADENFETARHTGNEAEFVLRAGARTLAAYPYHFVLHVCYRAEESSLIVTYTVENRDVSVMPFGIGCHTAYRWPLLTGDRPENSCLRFEREERLESFNPFGWRQLFVEGNTRPLSHELFRNYTRSMTGINSGWIAFQSASHPHGIRLHRSEFPFLAVWTLPDPTAELLCLEPCTSIHAGDTGCTRMEDREGNISLAPGGCWKGTFTVEFY